MTVVLVHVTRRINLKAVRGNYLPFIIKHALFPFGTTNLLASCSGLWGARVQTFVKHANFFTTSSWWHDITSTKVSCFLIIFNFLELKCQGTPCICMHGVTWHFNSKIYRKMIRNTWNLGWCNVMPPRWCGKEIGMFDESLNTHPSQTGATH